MNEKTQTRLTLQNREIILVGTAHISRESIEEVQEVIRNEHPDMVCVELDAGRLASMTQQDSWDKLDLVKVFKEGKGFLLMANLVLASFQRRLGLNMGVKPGDEMKAAIDTASELGIPFSLCDREVQLTLKRAWASCGFWSKNKLLATLISSAFTTEKIDEQQIESIKEKNELDSMMGELAEYLPEVKRTLIDERDHYLAAKIWASQGSRIVAVIGAGHMGGVVAHLEKISRGEATIDTSNLEQLPPPSLFSKLAPWIIPALIITLLIAGFFKSGGAVSINMLLQWMLWNGSLAALGTLAALGHPLSILTAFLGAPIATLNPFIGVGLFAGIVEATLRRPRVQDIEHLATDVTSLKGLFRNRVSRALLVFFLSSLGGAIGNFISIPFLTNLIIK
ncbi:TraB/GumN family protein [Gracilinema caldarium]|uniref:TraB family protein n=1 Tax=Gracilinema caldarium (strain ATCC 51460 / DSM 7334 / H1) TaxID=744872 RepID=F8EY35_GRAC1|nr:TraB/GumN family protein [Gracilinema caldarium]AEJ20696.1 TraB family protein [Gracilinema caldarium DSM 7334]